MECPACPGIILSAPDYVSDHDEASQEETQPFTPSTFLANPAFKKDLKALKARRKERNAVTRAMMKLRSEALAAWRQQIAEPVQQLRMAQKEAMAGLKATDTYKSFLSKTRGLELAKGRLRTKYGIKRNQMHHFLPRDGWTTRWSHRRLVNLRWAFRVVI